MSEEQATEGDGLTDAAVEVDYRWQMFKGAKTPLGQADALMRLNDAMSSFRSWLPGWDYEHDTMPWERADEA